MIEEYKYLRYLGGRKFSLAFASLISASILTWFGKIDPGVYSAVVIATVGVYITGNVWQHTKLK
jgi:hypothetical protein